MRKRFAILLLLLSFFAGLGVNNIHLAMVTYRGLTTPASIDVINLADSISWSNAAWKVEVQRRFPDAIVVSCHGGDDENGVWCLWGDTFDPLASVLTGKSMFRQLPPVPVEDFVRNIQKQRPGRQIVLLVCNPEHHTLKAKGVAYAMDSVWTIPDRAILPRSGDKPGDLGNIFEFVSQ